MIGYVNTVRRICFCAVRRARDFRLRAGDGGKCECKNDNTQNSSLHRMSSTGFRFGFETEPHAAHFSISGQLC
jgi:hypothetical protein